MDWKTKYSYHSLEDFLISRPLTVDAELNDGWGAMFPVKGIELEATIFFADISYFSGRTRELNPTEILIFVNNYFSWITAEAIKGRPCIIDKYIGDEVMVLFSKEFGSEDPFEDALNSARWMSENDMLNFCPHMGISSGLVTAGYVGTPLKYNCSVFGTPVTIASRCAGVRVQGIYGSSIVFPAELWEDRNLDEVFPLTKYKNREGKIIEQLQCWELREPRKLDLKNVGKLEIRELVNHVEHRPTQSAVDRAKQSLDDLSKSGHYHPKQV